MKSRRSSASVKLQVRTSGGDAACNYKLLWGVKAAGQAVREQHLIRNILWRTKQIVCQRCLWGAHEEEFRSSLLRTRWSVVNRIVRGRLACRWHQRAARNMWQWPWGWVEQGDFCPFANEQLSSASFSPVDWSVSCSAEWQGNKVTSPSWISSKIYSECVKCSTSDGTWRFSEWKPNSANALPAGDVERRQV